MYARTHLCVREQVWKIERYRESALRCSVPLRDALYENVMFHGGKFHNRTQKFNSLLKLAIKKVVIEFSVLIQYLFCHVIAG